MILLKIFEYIEYFFKYYFFFVYLALYSHNLRGPYTKDQGSIRFIIFSYVRILNFVYEAEQTVLSNIY